MLNAVCDMPGLFGTGATAALACAVSGGLGDDAAATGADPPEDGVPLVATGAPPMPCFCNSISTRFFSASNCCKLETCARGCDAGCVPAVAGAWG